MILEGSLQVSLWKFPAFLPSANLQICSLVEPMPILFYLHMSHSYISLAASSNNCLNTIKTNPCVLAWNFWKHIHEIHTPTSVYLNCCSTFFMTLPHSKHLKVPWRSSGRTSLVRVTTPVIDTNFPTSAVVKSLNLRLDNRRISI